MFSYHESKANGQGDACHMHSMAYSLKNRLFHQDFTPWILYSVLRPDHHYQMIAYPGFPEYYRPEDNLGLEPRLLTSRRRNIWHTTLMVENGFELRLRKIHSKQLLFRLDIHLATLRASSGSGVESLQFPYMRANKQNLLEGKSSERFSPACPCPHIE